MSQDSCSTDEAVVKIKERTESDRLYNFLRDPNKTAKEISIFLETIKGAGWTLLGNDIGRTDRYNKGSVDKNTTSDGTIGEITVNGKDAGLDLEHEKLRGDTERYNLIAKMSQREAAQELFGVPPEGLYKLSHKERKSIAERVGIVTIYPNYTLDVRDYGIGVEPQAFPSTVCSIEKGNKIGKFYNTGTYGFGGASSSSKSFCEYSVFISKKWKTDEVGLTIIRYQEPKEDEKDGHYWYLHIDGKIPAVKDDSFKHGTLKRHYEAHVSDVIRTSKSGMYNIYTMLRYIMPTTCLPMLLKDVMNAETTKDAFKQKKAREVVVIGVQDAIIQLYNDRKKGRTKGSKRDDRIRYMNQISRDLPDNEGSVNILYAVTGPTTKVKAYVPPHKPVILAEGGQGRGRLGNEIFRGGKVHYLRNNIIAIMTLDDIPRKIRGNMFGSNREEVKRGYSLKFSSMLQEVLEGDENILKLNDEYRELEIGKSAEKQDMKNRNLLVRFLNLTKKIIGPGPEDKETKDKPVVPPIILPEMIEVEPPTRLEFPRKKPLRLVPGRATTLTGITDAFHHYMNAVNSDLSRIHFRFGKDIAEFKSRQIEDTGRFHIFVKTLKDAKIGNTGEIRVWLTSEIGNKYLSDTIEYVIVEPKERVSKGPVIPEVEIVLVNYNKEEDLKAWEDMIDVACFKDLGDAQDVKKMASFMTIPKGEDVQVLLNVNAPQYANYYSNHKYKRTQFEARVKAKLTEYVAIQYVSRYFLSPKATVGECLQNVDYMQYYYHSNILSTLCFSVFCDIENKVK